MSTFDNVTLLYAHPHISIYVMDNTGYEEEEEEVSAKEFNGIQVGFFGSGRDNTLLYCQSTDELLNEYGNPDYKRYGQAAYNAYNALNQGYAGMYIMRLMPDDATVSNTVIMAKYKLVDEENISTPVIGNDMLELIGTNPVSQLVPDEVDGTTAGSTVFTLQGKVISGLTGDSNIDGLFSHITPEWLSGNNVGNFTVVTLKIPRSSSIVVGDDITITQTSAALKKFYSDFGMDSEHIIANADGTTATKTKTYSATDIFEGNDYITLSVLVSENDTVHLDINWGTDTENLIIRSSGIEFVDEIVADDVTEKKLAIAFESKSIEGATSIDKLQAEIANMYNEDQDENGYYYKPLMAFWALGRGSYGGNLRIQIADANSYDSASEPTARMYQVNILEKTNSGLTTKEYIYGMMNEDAFDQDYEDGPSLFLVDLVNDPDKGSAKVGMYFNSVVFDQMLELVNSTIEDEDDKYDVNTFDPIFGVNIDGSENEHVTMIDNSTDNGYVNLTAADGFALMSGNDGSLDPSTHTTEEIEATKEDLLIRAFNASIDRRIKSRYSTPADFCLDANFSDAVKRQMGVFAGIRKYDCVTYLDTKLLKTPTDVINYLKSMNNVYGYNIVKECHCYKYRDTMFSGKLCEMTITHWFAKAFVNHVKVYGIGEPFAKEKARISNSSDFVSGTFYPVIDPDDNDIKKQIYKYGANCYETVKHNVFQRSSAITTCKENSDRLDEFNEYITEKAIKLAHDLLSSKLYHITEDEDRSKFTKDAKQVIEQELAGLVKTCSVAFKMSTADKKRNILRIALRLTFNTVAKYGIAEVYLDPRVVSDATTTTA